MMFAKIMITPATLVLFGAIFAWSATTDARAETPDERQACISDAFYFCLSAIPNRSQVFSCLIENRALISAACHTVMMPYFPADPPKQSRYDSAIKWPLSISSH